MKHATHKDQLINLKKIEGQVRGLQAMIGEEKYCVDILNQIKAVKNGFEKMFPNQDFEFISVSVPSGVAEQPLSNDETFRGAKNRADNASKEIKDETHYFRLYGQKR